MFRFLSRPALFIAILVALSTVFLACQTATEEATEATPTPASESHPTEATPTPAFESHPTEAPTPTFDELKAASIQLSYDDLFRDNEEHIGKSIWYTGEVIQIIEGDGDEYQLRVNVTEGEIFWDDTVFLRYSGPRLLEDDIIEFIGRVNGLITYETVMGNNVTIPALTVIAHRRMEGAEGLTPTGSLSLRPTATPVSPESETVSPSPTLPLISTPSRTNAPRPTATPQPTATPEPTPTPPVGTRTNPVPVGEVAVYPNWDVSVVFFNRDATSVIAAENPYDDPPDPGHVYTMVRVQGTFTGTSFGSISDDLRFHLVADASLVYSEVESWIAKPPDKLGYQPNVLPGGTISGNIVFQVPANDADSFLLMVLDDTQSRGDTIGYFSMPENGTTIALSSRSAPRPTATPPPASESSPTDTPAFGTRGNPVPTSEVGVYPGWDVSVVSFNENATSLMAAAGRNNDPPDPGHVYVLVRVEGTYTGTGISSISSDLSFYLVGYVNILYRRDGMTGSGAYQPWVIPDSLRKQPGALSGGTVSGNIAFMVPANEVDSLLLVVTDGGLRRADTIGYFSLK